MLYGGPGFSPPTGSAGPEGADPCLWPGEPTFSPKGSLLVQRWRQAARFSPCTCSCSISSLCYHYPLPAMKTLMPHLSVIISYLLAPHGDVFMCFFIETWCRGNASFSLQEHCSRHGRLLESAPPAVWPFLLEVKNVIRFSHRSPKKAFIWWSSHKKGDLDSEVVPWC